MGSGAVCTAFLVSPSAVLTNFHCLNESTEYQRTRAQSTLACSDIEAQWFTPPDRIVVHDGHPRAARFRLILRRGRGVVKGLDGLGWSRYGTP